MKLQTLFRYAAVFLSLFFENSFSTSPHIIFMLIDDLGWNDVSFHGSKQIPTPNIDVLAYNGIILNNYYVQPLCTPSRGSLMTGKYPIKLGLQHYVIGAAEPWGLPPEEVLLPQRLKQLGYATHGVGKWHLGYFKSDYLPTNRGFDSFFGYWNGEKDYFTHFETEDVQSGLDFHDGDRKVWNCTGYYATEVFTDKAKTIIRNHDSSKPLFLYLSHQAVHSGDSLAPLQAPEEYIQKFSHIKDDERRVFAAMALALDKSIGEVFSLLYERNMLQNSIIVFSTDNGGAVEGLDSSTGSNWPLRGSKYSMWEGGVRGAAFIWSPFLLKSISENLMHISDWLPTLYAAAGGNPMELGEIDGYNFWPSFTENLSSPRDLILHNIDSEWKVEGIRKNQYKLLKGSVFNGKFDGWFNKQGKRTKNVHFEDIEMDILYEVYKDMLEESEIFKIWKSKHENHSNVSFKLFNAVEGDEYCDSKSNPFEECNNMVANTIEKCYIDHLLSPVEVQCGIKPTNASTNCQPMEEYCLFDIENDPCEFNNLASSLPAVVEELKELLDKYRKQAVPMRNKPAEPNANPKYYGYAWVPWMDEKYKQYITKLEG